MAVQAQYPSHVLLLHNNNTSNLQADYDNSSSPPPETLLLHHHHHHHQSPHMLFTTPGTTNPPKTSTQSRVPIGLVNNSISLQSPQLHHHHHQNTVSTGLQLSSFLHNQPIHLPQQSSQHASQSHHSSFSSHDLLSQIMQHRHELDQFLLAQEAELQRTLAQKRRRHYRDLLTAAEETVTKRLREKDLEIEKLTRINGDLQSRAANLAAESQIWQAKAKAQEETAASLQAQLQQAMAVNCTALENRDDGGGGGGGGDDAESVHVDPVRFEPAGPKCRGCGRKVASVVVLPCRHLCLCTECELHFRACPVCLSLKDSIVEVFLS